ncbi:lipopolysaccharide biosynthesis protein [Flavivirga rizhaonensis]|uniref:Lipopolysaccharide biosynthesis protein n=1 Tax=Flavivirga rizhaonensis TaxID=2559571 RepID=A0A4S1DV87_9FLAO|nr:lipopolysaccharide biosynthesis protein [Flavivirga rizhaonensis]TGV02006.1 lipopolysaccharide biosynthesis protein [Flavivirga rizhaonensis]
MKNKSEQKQVFWFTIINYLGIAIGIISTVFIYPKDKEFLGVFRYIYAIAGLLFPVMIFGAGQALINFYPIVSKHNQKKLFKYGIATIFTISFVLFLGVLLVDAFFTIENYKYVYYAFPIGVSLAFIELFKRQATNINKLSIPTLFEKIIPKIALPVVFILLLSGFFEVEGGLVTLVISYFILLGCLSIYVFNYYRVNLDFSFKSLFSQVSKKGYYRYSFYAFLGSFGSFLAFRLDTLMIPEFLSFEANGTYSIGVILASVIAIPATGVFSIYAPLVSKYIKNQDIDMLGRKYVENAKLLFFVGAIFYGAIVLGIDSFFKLLPTYEKLVDTIPIIFILGVNVLFNMATGFSSEIISYSKYYRTNIILVLILVILNIGLNLYVLILTDYGIIGVAWASFIAMTAFNLFKVFYIYSKFKILPFDKGYFQLFVITLFVGMVFYWIPEMKNNVANILVKSCVFILTMVYIVFKLKLVYALNYWIDKIFKT